MEKKIVITGAPGTGKTSIIDQLKKLGYSCSEEISREIIAEQIASGGKMLPWIDLETFSQSIFSLRKAQYINAPTDSLHFFDRGLLDVVAYMKADALSISKHYKEECKKYRYNTTVFYTPIWEEIYKTDSQRKEDLNSAITIEKSLLDTYKSFGYCLNKIPKLSTNDRVDFIISKLEL
ncbi:MAG TPA: AAA family ATPase [Flavobacteriales bacterium]|jgi:predicted ATPase|nr:AAA family ATPase [Flavobacteriales bacterium]